MLGPESVGIGLETALERSADVYKNAADNIPTRPVPDWLELNTSTMSGLVRIIPLPEHVDNQIDSRVIVEFYSR